MVKSLRWMVKGGECRPEVQRCHFFCRGGFVGDIRRRLFFGGGRMLDGDVFVKATQRSFIHMNIQLKIMNVFV